MLPKALSPRNNILENFTKTLFSLTEWLIILTTLKFAEIKTGDFIIGLIFQICFIAWVFFLIKKILKLIKGIINIYFYIKNNQNKKIPKPKIIPIIIAFIFGGTIGTISVYFIFGIIQKIFVTF